MSETIAPSKPPLRRYPSDDCAVTVGGEIYYPHRGESLWLRGGAKYGQIKTSWSFTRISVALDEAAPDPKAESESDDEFRERAKRAHDDQLRIVEAHYDDLVTWLSRRIVRWDWTDDDGKLLPALDGTEAPFLDLTTDELFYLSRVVSGEAPAEVGNDDSTSPPI